jgi:hypothetical protein
MDKLSGHDAGARRHRHPRGARLGPGHRAAPARGCDHGAVAPIKVTATVKEGKTILRLQTGARAHGSAPDSAAPARPNARDPTKGLSNPVAALIGVPFQPNHDRGIGPAAGLRLCS